MMITTTGKTRSFTKLVGHRASAAAMRRSFGGTEVSRAIEQKFWANNFQITSERRFGFDFITLGSFRSYLNSQTGLRPNSWIFWWSSVVSCTPSSTIYIWSWIFFLYRSAILVFFRAGRFAKNPMHKLFSVNSEAETLKILLALHFPLTMVRCSKGGRKVFLPILHLLPYDLLFKGWSWNFPAERGCFKGGLQYSSKLNTCYMFQEVHSLPYRKNKIKVTKNKWGLVGLLDFQLIPCLL